MVTGYLKWADEGVGVIHNHSTIQFLQPHLNPVVTVITQGATEWTREQFVAFLVDRIVSGNRRDIERLLFLMKLVEYDPIKIAEITYAINPKDLLWIAPDDTLTFKEAVGGAFENIFRMGLGESGSSISTPDGQNIKEYAISNGYFGINKKRLHPFSLDAEAEVAVYKLGQLLGVDVCPAWFVGTDTIFSKFVYDFSREYVVHARRFLRGGDLYVEMVATFPHLEYKINQMCLLDFVTRQDDRHMSNIAILMRGDSRQLYPLYDNGRSLFYEDTETLVAKALSDIPVYATSFGEVGTYYDVVEKIAKKWDVGEIINLDVSRDQVHCALSESGYTDFRLAGAVEWVCKALELLKGMR